MNIQIVVAFCAPLIVGGIWTAVVILADIRKLLLRAAR
jgi:hypothetical protein